MSHCQYAAGSLLEDITGFFLLTHLVCRCHLPAGRAFPVKAKEIFCWSTPISPLALPLKLLHTSLNSIILGAGTEDNLFCWYISILYRKLLWIQFFVGSRRTRRKKLQKVSNQVGCLCNTIMFPASNFLAGHQNVTSIVPKTRINQDKPRSLTWIDLDRFHSQSTENRCPRNQSTWSKIRNYPTSISSLAIFLQ